MRTCFDGGQWVKTFEATGVAQIEFWIGDEFLGTWETDRLPPDEVILTAFRTILDGEFTDQFFAEGRPTAHLEAREDAKFSAEIVELSYLGDREPELLPDRFSIRSWEDVNKAMGVVEGIEFDEILTFVVDSYFTLWIARSEHVDCARHRTVYTAGEIMFTQDLGIDVSYSSNQSTGFCPPRRSVHALRRILAAARIGGSCRWTGAFIFRLCPLCNEINVVKDNHFYCGTCESPLPHFWNFLPYIYRDARTDVETFTGKKWRENTDLKTSTWSSNLDESSLISRSDVLK